MDIHYNAFISYRHHPTDIKVATQIHRLLEHYRVPRSFRKTHQGITRLFRDKDELPITSNLTTDITNALENSDYLIVICSTHTKESVWVQREIETFLKTHDRSKVLTVLVDGEPYDTIPEILLKEERVDPETGAVTIREIEPLSCDWRVKPSKAKREELPRLAAALLGCGYNELRQRERQYRTRRMVAAFSAAMMIVLGFLGYFIYSNAQIQKANEQLNVANQQLQDANIEIQNNLDQSLKNQSLFLANAATDLLEDGDRLTAIALALEALPEYQGERPYSAEAELALGKAVGTYSAKENIVAVGSMNCDYLIRNFKLTDDGRWTYIQDDRYVVTVWDNKTLEKTGTVTLEFPATEMIPTSAGNMLFYSDWRYKLQCCDSNGTILWTAEECKDVAILEDRDVIMVCRGAYNDISAPYLFTVRFLDVNTGEEVQEAITFEGPDSNTTGIYFLKDSYGPEQSVGIRLTNWDDYLIYTLDPDTGALQHLYTWTDRSIRHVGFTGEGHFLILHSDDEFSMRGSYDNMITTQEATFTLSCLDHVTGKILWETEICTYVYGSLDTLEMIPDSNNILCQLDNAFLVLDSATGKILSRCDVDSRPIWTRVDAESTMFLLESGHMGFYNYARNESTSGKYMPEGLAHGEVNGGGYAVKNLSTQLTVYRSTRDENWTKYTGDYANNIIVNRLVFNNLLILQSHYDLYVIDTKENKILWSDGGDISFDAELLGVSHDGTTLWCTENDNQLVAYDLRTGKAEKTPLPNSAQEENCYITDEHYLRNEKLYYVAQGYNTDIQYLFCYDIKTGTYDYWNICTEQPMDTWSIQKVELLAFADTYILLWENTNKTIYELDLKTGAVTTVMTEVTACPAALAYREDRYLLGANNMIQRRDRNGNVEMTIQLDSVNAGAFYLYEDQILALCDDGKIYRYTQDGKYISNIGLYLYSDFQSDIAEEPFDLKWDFTNDGSLILDVYGYGNIIDCGTWQLKAYAKDMVAYLPEKDALVVSVDGLEGGVGEFARISTQELMKQAKEILGDFELSEEQRVSYGLVED